MKQTLDDRLYQVNPYVPAEPCAWCGYALGVGEGMRLRAANNANATCRFCDRTCAEEYEADRISRYPKAKAQRDAAQARVAELEAERNAQAEENAMLKRVVGRLTEERDAEQAHAARYLDALLDAKRDASNVSEQVASCRKALELACDTISDLTPDWFASSHPDYVGDMADWFLSATGVPLAHLTGEVACPDCDGRGWYVETAPSGDPEQVPCEKCKTTGKLTGEKEAGE